MDTVVVGAVPEGFPVEYQRNQTKIEADSQTLRSWDLLEYRNHKLLESSSGSIGDSSRFGILKCGAYLQCAGEKISAQVIRIMLK